MSDDPNNGCEGDYDNGRILVIIDMAFTWKTSVNNDLNQVGVQQF